MRVEAHHERREAHGVLRGAADLRIVEMFSLNGLTGLVEADHDAVAAGLGRMAVGLPILGRGLVPLQVGGEAPVVRHSPHGLLVEGLEPDDLTVMVEGLDSIVEVNPVDRGGSTRRRHGVLSSEVGEWLMDCVEAE